MTDARKALADRLLPKETLDYVSHFGSNCRDCADNDGICPSSGLPCGISDRLKAIKRVIDAINYGTKQGFLKVRSPLTGTREEVVERAARAIAKSQGHDPDDLAPRVLMCTADNQQVPWSHVFEEQALAVLAALSSAQPSAGTQDREEVARAQDLEVMIAREAVTEWLGMFDPPPQIDFIQSEMLQGAIASALALVRPCDCAANPDKGSAFEAAPFAALPPAPMPEREGPDDDWEERGAANILRKATIEECKLVAASHSPQEWTAEGMRRGIVDAIAALAPHDKTEG